MSSSTGVQTEDSQRVGRFGEAWWSRIVWVSIAVTAVLRTVVIFRSFYWQDDYVHIWTTWNAPASEMILQDWNGHREPLAFGIQWVVAHFWPHVWWPAALILVLLSTALPIAFWLAARGIAGVTPASATAAVGFALWPGLLIPETWFSAGLETFSLLAIIAAIAVHTRRLRWSTWLIVAMLIVGFGFNERALFMLPVLFATAYLSSHGGPVSRCRQAFRADTRLWVALAVTTAALAGLAVAGSPGSSGGEPAPLADVIRGLWFAGPGGLVNDVAGMNLFWPDERSTLPSGTPVWAVVLTAIVWGCLIVVASLRDAAQLAHSAGVICVFLVVETAAVAMLRGGFIGPTVHQDPRYYLITGTVLLLSVASFGATGSGPRARTAGWLMVPIAAIVVLGSLASMAGIAVTTDGTRSRSWLASARVSFVGTYAPPLVPTPSPPLHAQRHVHRNHGSGGGVRTGYDPDPAGCRFRPAAADGIDLVPGRCGLPGRRRAGHRRPRQVDDRPWFRSGLLSPNHRRVDPGADERSGPGQSAALSRLPRFRALDRGGAQRRLAAVGAVGGGAEVRMVHSTSGDFLGIRDPHAHA